MFWMKQNVRKNKRGDELDSFSWETLSTPCLRHWTHVYFLNANCSPHKMPYAPNSLGNRPVRARTSGEVEKEELSSEALFVPRNSCRAQGCELPGLGRHQGETTKVAYRHRFPLNTGNRGRHGYSVSRMVENTQTNRRICRPPMRHFLSGIIHFATFKLVKASN